MNGAASYDEHKQNIEVKEQPTNCSPSMFDDTATVSIITPKR